MNRLVDTKLTQNDSSSSVEPLVVLVNDEDEALGTMPRLEAHTGMGQLHRAISAFLYDQEGKIMLQQRASFKPLWGGFWSNSCCTHPFPGESTSAAAHRRIQQELGVDAELTFQFKIKYQASFTDSLAEHELVSVFTGQSEGALNLDPAEVADIRCETPEDLDRWIETNPEQLTPWLILEWNELRKRKIF